MWNPDGSESEMCGNGVRCFALFAIAEGLTEGPTIPVMTGAGPLVLTVLEGGRVKVDMGQARLARGEIGMTGPPDATFVDEPIEASFGPVRGTAVSMGNPHLVLFVKDVASVPLQDWGTELERHPLFPRRTNVHFVQVKDHGHIVQRTWERGAGATLACGTGACASAVAAFLNGHTGREVVVSLPGGDLEIVYQDDGRVFMTGPAVAVYSGVWG
jgi:diaminopimelate epimerase